MLLGGQGTQQPTIDGSGEGDGWDSGWQRLAIGDGGRWGKC